MEKATELNSSAVDMCERITRQNSSDILRMDGRQPQVERKLRSLEGAPSGNSNEGGPSGSLKLTPKQPIFNETSQPTKFLEELKNFWEAVRPSPNQFAFVIGSCLRGTAKDWWDLTKETDDDLHTFCDKFRERYWGESVQHEAKARLEFGFYQVGPDINMTTYALQAFREAKSLTPPLDDKEIIRKLARHFNEDIRGVIIGRSISKLKDLLCIMEGFDRCGPLIHKGQRRPLQRKIGGVDRQRRGSTEVLHSSATLGHPKGQSKKKTGRITIDHMLGNPEKSGRWI